MCKTTIPIKNMRLFAFLGALLSALLLLSTPVAAITFVGATGVVSSTNTSLSFSAPAGTAAGDLMLVQLSVRGGTATTLTAPSGWTLLRRDNNGSILAQAVYYKFATATEPASTTWGISPNNRAVGAIIAYRGVDTAAPINASGGQINAFSLSVTAPSVTTTVANARLVGFFGTTNGNTSFTSPSGMAERIDVGTGAGPNGVTITVTDSIQADAVASGTRTATAKTAAANIGQLVALRPVVVAPDHIQIDYPAPPFSTCSPTSVKVYACGNAACTAFYTGGVSVTLSPGGNVVSIPAGSGSASATVFQTSAGTATLDAVSVPAELAPTTCKNVSSGTFSCSVTFSAAALSVTVPNLVSGNTVTGSISGCLAQLPKGANTINFFTAYQNPASGTKQATITTTLQATTTLATGSPGTAISLSFDGASPSSSASFSLSYPDVGMVGLTATKGSASGSASFIAVPHRFTLSNISCVSGCVVTPNPGAADASGAAFMKAGNPFSLSVTALNASGVVTPNFGKETPAESVSLTPAANMPDLTGAVAGNLTCNTVTATCSNGTGVNGIGVAVVGGFNAGAASNAVVYAEAGIMTLTTRLFDPDSKGYLSIGNQLLSPAGGVSANIGRFTPDHFTITTDPSSPILTRANFPQTLANAIGTTAPATVIGVNSIAGFSIGTKVRIPGAGTGSDALTTTVTAVNAAGPTLTLGTAISTTLNGGEAVIAEWGSYMGERFDARFRLMAVDFSDNITQNYQGVYAKLERDAAGNLLAKIPLQFGAVNAGINLTARLDTSLPTSGSFTAGTADIAAPLAISRGVAPDGPYAALQIGIAPTDSDGVRMGPYNLNVGGSLDRTSIMNASVQATTEVRFGRLRLQNAHGSELLGLPIPMTVQHWNGSAFVTNIDDNLTSIAANNIKLQNYRDGITATNLPQSKVIVGGAFLQGVGSLRLDKPSLGAIKGSVDLCVDLWDDPVGGTACSATKANLSYLQGLWAPGASYNNDPAARASFGLYRGSKSLIYFREMY